MTAKPTTDGSNHQTTLATRLEEIELHKLSASPFNPRTRFDEDALTMLAESIRQEGVLEPIIVRPIPFGENVLKALKSADPTPHQRYEIVAGERRYRAAKEAQQERIPCLIRDLDDTQARIIAVTENKQRSDLDPLDEARGYQILKDGGMPQSEIAEKLGVSAGEVSKSLALLQLPATAQEQLRAGHISTGVARAVLMKWGRYPVSLPVVIDEAIKNGATVREIENPEASHNWNWKLAEALIKKDVARDINGASFDNDQCDQCPHKALVKLGYKSLCMKPGEFDAKDLEAKAAATAAALALAEKLQQAHQKTTQRAGEPEGAKKTKTPTLVNLKTLPYNSYERLGNIRPTGCSDECPCIGAALDNYKNNAPCKICTDPNRYRGLQAADTRKANKEKRKQADADQAEILAWSVAPEPTEPGMFGKEGWWAVHARRSSLATAMVAHKMLYNVGVKQRRAVCNALLKTERREEILPMLDFLNAEGNKADKCLGALMAWLEGNSLNRELLIGACAQVITLAEVERVIGWGGGYSSPEIALQLLERKSLRGYEEAKKAKSEEGPDA